MNKNILSKLGMFVFGAAVGSVVTWKLIEAKYKQIAQEEIDSVREVYAKVYGDSDEEEEPDEDDTETDKAEYDHIIHSSGYGTAQDVKETEVKRKKKEEEEEEDKDMPGPYVIDYDDFDENGYETESLYYYDDGVLINSITNEIIEDIDGTVGTDSIEQLKGSGEDYIYVRNDELGIDYEILRDRRNFSEVD